MGRRKATFSKVLVVLVLLLSVVSFTVWMSCEKGVQSPVAPVEQEGLVLNKDNAQIRAVMAVQEQHTPSIFANKDVVGTAVGLTEDGRPALLVLTKTIALHKGLGLPEEIDGIPVVVRQTGEIKPMKVKPTPISHTAKQTPPIKLGTSGGWRYDLANGYCCGGTLGSMIQIGAKKYILSNYHVFESDIVLGGNNRIATTGDPIIQPGLIDVSCNAANAQNVATLVKSSSLPGSNVDASIAEIISGMVDATGAILEIGTISSTTASAFLNQKVKKSGRTTGLTRSYITGLNGIIQVAYDDECAGGQAFVKTYTGQIIIANKRSKFLAGGDSGSLMVEDVATNPKAIGLLYAGSRVDAIANPIGEVLNFFGATMVGQ